MENSENYLFFDVECANCFEGIGKICSFGYALTDERFNILETDDIVINPECEFDWFLFKNKDDIKLAYSKNHFFKQPNFSNFYDRINSLCTERNSKVFGFSSLNDVGFVLTACERYNLPVFDFAAYDLEKIIKKEDEIFGSLEKRCQILGVDNSDLTPHKSSDDAVMTMRLLKAFCEKNGLTANEICQNNRCFLYSTEDFKKARELRAKKKAKKAEFGKKYSDNKGKKAGTNHFKSDRRKDSRTITFE